MTDGVSYITTGEATEMRTVLGLVLAAITLHPAQLPAQNNSKTANSPPLVLTGAIPLENVHGRIDHFGFDSNNRLFVSALGNNTEEVIDLSAQRVVHTISGVPAQQTLFEGSCPSLGCKDGRYEPGLDGFPPYDVSADGKRFLFVKPTKGQATANEINVTVGWAAELQSKFRH